MKRAIVCGVDGSPDSEAALAVAAGLADRVGARLIVANVVEHIPSPYATVGALGPAPVVQEPPGAALRDRVEAGERLLAKLAEEAHLDAAERRVLTGLAAERLADLADELDAELIVVGSRGRGAFKAAFLGSVSTSLIGVARCPVLVVPPGARE
jgi:nucleotide-binding universal stress UspA family protein